VSIVITGATGLLGPMIIDELIGRGVPANGIVGAGRDPGRLAGRPTTPLAETLRSLS
jgi:NAD(P)H dehydrogenase (quinone)